MTNNLEIWISVACKQCGRKIYEVEDSGDGSAIDNARKVAVTHAATHPTPDAANACPVCGGKKYVQTKSRGLVPCATCNAGKRR